MADGKVIKTLDHPIPFLLFVTVGVIGMSALLGWLFASLNMTGPLGLVKGGQAG